MDDKKKTYTRRDLFRGAFLRPREEQSVVKEREQSPAILDEADEHFAQGAFERAASLYQQFLKSRTARSDVRKRYGLSLYHQGKHVQARVEFSRILKRERTDQYALLMLGLTQLKTGQSQRAGDTWKSLTPSFAAGIRNFLLDRMNKEASSADQILEQVEPKILEIDPRASSETGENPSP